MKIKTRDFGEQEIGESGIYHFAQPLFGFESYTDFVLLSDAELGGNIVWLQSVQEPGLCFILVDPSGMHTGFQPTLPSEVTELLGEGSCLCWVVAVVPADFKESTVNLKCPLFFNETTHRAAQVMLEEDYPVRFFFLKEERG